jgi:acetyl esterase/lipase
VATWRWRSSCRHAIEAPAAVVSHCPLAANQLSTLEIVGTMSLTGSQASAPVWRDWFCDPAQRRDPLVSPLWADLRNLPPIYIQAGSAEILYDSIREFADHGKNQGADVVLESWEDMTHDFQIFGHEVPQSADALRRFGEVIAARVRGREKKGN